MKKPMKKKLLPYKPESSLSVDYRNGRKKAAWIRGYNQACDDFRKFLPSEKEIRDLLNSPDWNNGSGKDWMIDWGLTDLVKAIIKRIGGRK